MESLVDKGLVKSIGVSNFNVQLLWDMTTYARIMPAVNEIELHPLNAQKKLLDFLKSENIVPIAYCPLARGSETSRSLNLIDHQIINDICKKHSAAGSQILLAWGLQRGCI